MLPSIQIRSVAASPQSGGREELGSVLDRSTRMTPLALLVVAMVMPVAGGAPSKPPNIAIVFAVSNPTTTHPTPASLAAALLRGEPAPTHLAVH